LVKDLREFFGFIEASNVLLLPWLPLTRWGRDPRDRVPSIAWKDPTGGRGVEPS
jgi:hypothetical protein